MDLDRVDLIVGLTAFLFDLVGVLLAERLVFLHVLGSLGVHEVEFTHERRVDTLYTMFGPFRVVLGVLALEDEAVGRDPVIHQRAAVVAGL